MKPRGYLSYLLRLWQTSDGEQEIWRASLECPGEGERINFASFAALVAYLETELAAAEVCELRPRLDELHR